jgi:hypothetical protein
MLWLMKMTARRRGQAAIVAGGIVGLTEQACRHSYVPSVTLRPGHISYPHMFCHRMWGLS